MLIAAAFGQPAVSITASAPTAPVPPGQSVTMGVSATGSPVTYQWKLNGTDIPGATATSYTLVAAGAADRGPYQVVATGSGGSTTAEIGTLAVMTSDARLVNLSARGMVGTGGNVMIAGFVSQGDTSSTNKNILMRGMGPALGGMGGMMQSGMLTSPVLTVYDGQSNAMAADTGWMNAPVRATGGGASTVPATMQTATLSMMNAVGAFAPTAGSADSALMMNAPFGAYTAVMSGSNNSSGVALAECYDADQALGNGANSAYLINMSARANVGAGDNALIAGFVIAAGPSGNSATVLLRAMGPALSPLGVAGALSSPSMTLYDSGSKPIATGSGWSVAPVMATGGGASTVRAGIEPASAKMMTQVGAFPPAAGSADCALIATLPPGAYSVVVSGLPDNSGKPMTGVVLVEVYNVR